MLKSFWGIRFIKYNYSRIITTSSLIPDVILRRKIKLFHDTTKLMKERPNSSAVDDWLIVDPDANISPSQFQKARTYMKIDKLKQINQNKWEKPKSLFSKKTNVGGDEDSFKSNSEKNNLFGTKWDKSNTISLGNHITKSNGKSEGFNNNRENLPRNRSNKDSRGKNNERTQISEIFNEGSRKNWAGSKNFENSYDKTIESKGLKFLRNKEMKRVQPSLSQADIKPENKVDFISALTELKAAQEINVEDEDDSLALRAHQKFSFKKDKVAEISEHRKHKSFKKERELKEDDGYFDVDYEVDKPKKKNQTRQIEQKLQREIFIPNAISVSNLAKMIGVRLVSFEQKLQNLGIEYVSHDHLLNAEEASLIAMEYNLNPVVNSEAAIDLFPKPKPADMSKHPLRPPVIAILGHVDHGKTTLLDTLRKSSVAAGEAGGITQHIGAFSVSLPSKKTITFLDTPGHAAFSAMRARGAHVTDIVVLVVASDDGVMPQTLEAIKHAKDAGVPIVVAINKIDRHNANPKKVRESLLANGVELEEYDGETQSVEVSGLTGQGLDKLEEAIIALAELSDFRAEVDIEAEGAVIESQMEKGKGYVATVLVKRGTLKQGDVIVAGTTWCKVRMMTDDKGQIIKNALPGTPVRIVGWKELPVAGDEMLQATDEELAKTVISNRELKKSREKQLKDLEVINEKRRQRKLELETERTNVRNFKKEVWMFHQGLLKEYPIAVLPQQNIKEEKDTNITELNVIVKADVSGTSEAVVDALYGLSNKEVRVNVINSGVGDIIESDIHMASIAKAIILGFNVKADKKVQSQASIDNVDMKFYKVIYHLLDDVREQLSKLLPPILEKHVIGEATILQIFQINIKGKEFKSIAGCRVTNGTILKNKKVRILRDNNQIWEGSLETLKQVKKDINEVKKGSECGISFEGFTDFKEGDFIQSIVVKEIPRSL